VQLLPQAAQQLVIRAAQNGFVTQIQTDELGRIVQEWGGGRLRLEDKIDYGVGLEIHAKLGQRVQAGEALLTAYYNNAAKCDEMQDRLQAAYRIAEQVPDVPALIRATI
jgi:pyrimidine-nucleoside phosphorylase